MSKVRLRKIVLPQSASDAGEDLSAFDTVYAREETTWKILRDSHPDVRLLPDMALSLRLPASQPKLLTGLFLRTDIEATGLGGTDPVQAAKSVQEYISLAGNHERIITNRLHFGIAALLQGRQCSLRRNSYHKNQSVFNSWLRLFPSASWED